MRRPHRTIWPAMMGTALAAALACPAAFAAESVTPTEDETPAIEVTGVGDAGTGDAEAAGETDATGSTRADEFADGTSEDATGTGDETEADVGEDPEGTNPTGDAADGASDGNANESGATDVADAATTPQTGEGAEPAETAEATYAHEQTAEQNGVVLHVAWNDPVLGEETTFHVYATGGSTTSKFFMNSVGYVDTDGSVEGMVNDIEHGKKDYTESCSSYDYQFTFMATGTYKLWFAVQDLPSGVYSLRLLLDVPVSDPAFPSVAQRIDAAVAQCNEQPDQSEYGRALWLHDWLLSQLEYDHSYYWCSPEAALCRGLGTCEGYQQTYAKLLDKAGIANGRLVGNGHTWNAVKIDGSWYQVDPTWDGSDLDPSSGSGYDHKHLYFGLTDELMAQAHSDHTGNYQAESYAYRSSGLADNYFMRNGDAEAWANTYIDDIQKHINALDKTFVINTYDYDGHGIINSLISEQLNQQAWSNSYGTVILNASGTRTGLSFSPSYSPTTTYLNVSDYKPSKAPSTWSHPDFDGHTFVGWYADASCTQPYMETTGFAYALFVRASDFAHFTGCSLRDDGRGDDVATLRFCYEFSVPAGTTMKSAGWTWRNARSGVSGTKKVMNYWLSGNGNTIIANIALTGIKRDGTTKFSDAWEVTGSVTYDTPDGTSVCITEDSSRTNTVFATAQASTEGGASDAVDKAYAKRILGEEVIEGQDDSFVVYPMQMWVGSYKNGSNDSSTWKAPTFAGFNGYENYIFVGWFKDKECTEVFTDVKGNAYAKFVPPTNLVRFTGCSLRDDGQGTDKTTLRFCYEFAVPQGTALKDVGWSWKNVDANASGSTSVKNYWLSGGNSIMANIAFANISRTSAAWTFDSTICVIGSVTYTTPDGTNVTVSDPSAQTRTVVDAARATSNGGAGDSADKAYANSILGIN